jgi:hypothetical protein
MRKRGPRNTYESSLSLVPPVEAPRPEPPEHLSEQAKGFWRRIVAEHRADWFRGTEFLLEIYVDLLVAQHELDAALVGVDPVSKDGQILASQRRANANLILRYARSMRLTQRSTFDRYSPRLTAVPPGTRRPWDPPPARDDEPDGDGGGDGAA